MICNASELGSRGRLRERRAAMAIAEAGLRTLDPEKALRNVVAREANSLIIEGKTYSLKRSVHVLGGGKASFVLARTIEALLGDVVSGGLVVAPESHATSLKRIEVVVGDHPVPTERSTNAGGRIMNYAETVETGDLVICLFTGGSSALVSLGPSNVPSEAKRDLHALLVGSGLDILSVNTVRKHVSRIKGGRLAAALRGRDIINLTISDVAGDVFDSITDPTVQDSTTADDAVNVLKAEGLWEIVHPSIRTHLRSSHAESPDVRDQLIHTVLLINGQTACDAMTETATELDLRPLVVSTNWQGDACEFGNYLADLSLSHENTALIGCGGETTVRLGSWDQSGLGGPNQELAIAAALAFDGDFPAAVLAIDTDGSDGNSDYAGGLIDDETSALWQASGFDADDALAAHRSSAALSHVGSAVVTGPTLTNVNDLFVVVTGNRS